MIHFVYHNGWLQYFQNKRSGNLDPVANKSHDAYACCFSFDSAVLLFGIMITWLQTVRKTTLIHLQIVRTGSNKIFRTVNDHEDSIFLRNWKRESHLTLRLMRFWNKNYFTHSGYEILKWDYHSWISLISIWENIYKTKIIFDSVSIWRYFWIILRSLHSPTLPETPWNITCNNFELLISCDSSIFQ